MIRGAAPFFRLPNKRFDCTAIDVCSSAAFFTNQIAL